MQRPRIDRVAVGLAALIASGVLSGCSGGVSSGASAVPATTSPSPSPGMSYELGRYQPLWPFASVDEAMAWQRGYRAGGHQPWHLSADQSALAFARYLGFPELDRVTSRTVADGEAHIGVG